jgi:hypothetical protein
VFAFGCPDLVRAFELDFVPGALAAAFAAGLSLAVHARVDPRGRLVLRSWSAPL